MNSSTPASKVSSAPKAAPKPAAKAAPARPDAARVEAPAAGEGAAPPRPQIDRLAELFRDKPATSPDDAAATGESPVTGEAAERPTKAKPPKGLKELAEKLELDPETLYALEIPTSDGKTKTLGQLKDLAAREGDLSVRELRIEEDRTQREADLLTAQQELRELVEALPKDAVKPEVLNAVRQKHEAKARAERTRTLELIPEWKNEQRRGEDLTAMVEHMKSYGFPANFLGTVLDARVFKYVRENWLREQRIRKALEQVQPAAPGTVPKSKAAGRAPAPPAAKGPRRAADGRSRLMAIFNS